MRLPSARGRACPTPPGLSGKRCTADSTSVINVGVVCSYTSTYSPNVASGIQFISLTACTKIVYLCGKARNELLHVSAGHPVRGQAERLFAIPLCPSGGTCAVVYSVLCTLSPRPLAPTLCHHVWCMIWWALAVRRHSGCKPPH